MDLSYDVFKKVLISFTYFHICLLDVAAGESCPYIRGGNTRYVYCEYSCCGDEKDRTCCEYEMSSSVLIVASVVSGLVLIALIAAVIICCYKSYKDKQTSRVRSLRQQQHTRNAPIQPAEPPKPPQYIEAPPAYSEDMPDSHFRPQTASAQYTPYNQRFSGVHYPQGQPMTRSHASRLRNSTQNGDSQNIISSSVEYNGVAMTNTSGRHPARVQQVNQSVSAGTSNDHIPGSITEAPPPYSEFARGQTPAHRRGRFIQTPEPIPNQIIEEGTNTPASRESQRTSSSRGSRIPTRVQTTFTSQTSDNQSRNVERSSGTTSAQSQPPRTRMNLRSTTASRTTARITEDIEDIEHLAVI